MGYEWHDRNRDLLGRFERGYDLLPDQIHIRVSKVEGQKIRYHALQERKELSEWCRDVLTDYIRIRERQMTENGKNGGTYGIPSV